MGLAGNKTLETMNLQDIGLTEHVTEGLMGFGEMLATNTGLQVVDLRMNHIGDAGGKILAEALAKVACCCHSMLRRDESGGLFLVASGSHCNCMARALPCAL